MAGSTSATTLLYAGGISAVVGQQGFTSAFANVSLVVASIARAGNVVTVTTAGNFAADLNGLTLTVQGVADSSYNGNYAVTTTGPNTLTYTDNGPDSTSSGGTLTFLTRRLRAVPDGGGHGRLQHDDQGDRRAADAGRQHRALGRRAMPWKSRITTRSWCTRTRS